jgi:hypothetical protein
MSDNGSKFKIDVNRERYSICDFAVFEKMTSSLFFGSDWVMRRTCSTIKEGVKYIEECKKLPQYF